MEHIESEEEYDSSQELDLDEDHVFTDIQDRWSSNYRILPNTRAGANTEKSRGTRVFSSNYI